MADKLLSSRERSFRAFIFSVISLTLVGLIRIIFSVVVGRTFNVEVLGMATVALSVALFASMVCATGFINSINKFIGDSLSRNETGKARNILESFLRFSLFLSIPIIAAIWFLNESISDLLNIDTGYLIAAIPIIFLGLFYYLFRATYYSLGASKAYMKRELAGGLMFIGTLLLLVALDLPSLVLIAFSAMYLLFIILSAFDVDKRLPPASSEGRGLPSGIHAFTVISTIATMMSLSTIYVANMYTGAALGAWDAGLYAAAFSAMSIVLLIPNGLALVLLPEISYLWGKNRLDSIRKYVSRWTTAILLLSAAIVGSMIILSEDIIMLLFSSDFVSADDTMRVLLLGVLSIIIARPAISALVGTEYVKFNATVSVIAFCCALAAWFVLVPLYGILGTAFGYLIAATMNSLGPILYSRKMLSVDLRDNVIPVILFSALLLLLFNFMPMETSIDRIVATTVFIAIFVAGNFRLARRVLSDIRRF